MTRTLGVIAASWTAAAFLSAALTAAEPPAAGPAPGPLRRAIGSASEAVGDVLFRHSDVYYHGGVEERFEHESSPLLGQQAPADALGEIHDDAPRGDWAAWLKRHVRSYEHRHLSGVDQQELLPIFYFATKLNPRNLDAALTTAYWLDRRMDRPDHAVRVLEETLAVNPSAWQASASLGELLLRRGRDPADAERFLRRALADESGQANPHERVELYYRLGLACRRQAKEAEAAAAFRGARAELEAIDPSAALLGELDRLSSYPAPSASQAGSAIIITDDAHRDP